MNTLQVKAAPGLSVPMEDKPRTYINDTDNVTVPDSSYYQRRLADGDLIQQDNQPGVDLAQTADSGKKAASRTTVKPTGE